MVAEQVIKTSILENSVAIQIKLNPDVVPNPGF